ncbi:PREDICTED: mucin-4 [Apaloderma vittatum]|nr:PREDICTED: mucin-4 [Apaloderma vittatum]
MAVALTGMVSPTVAEPLIASSPGLAHSTAEPDASVPRKTRPVAPSVTSTITITGPAAGDTSFHGVTTPYSAVLSSASAPHSPRTASNPYPETTDSTHNTAFRALSPAADNETTAGVSSLALDRTHTWETTTASWSSAEGTTTCVDTTLSESGVKGAAPSAGTNSIHVPISNNTGTSPATTPATSMFPRSTIVPPTLASSETFMVTRATTAMLSAMLKTTSTSTALSLTVTRDEAGGDGQSTLSLATRTPSVEATPSSAIEVPGPTLSSPAEESAEAPSFLLGVGATREPAAGQTPTELSTRATSPTVTSSPATGQAASMSPPGFWTSLGAPVWGEKTVITTGSTTTITAGNTTTITAGNTMAIAAGNTTNIAAGNTTAITAANTTEITAGNITVITAGNITTIISGNTTTITARNTQTTMTTGNSTAITAGNTTTVTSENTTTITARNTLTTTTTGNSMAITAGKTTTLAARNTMAITVGNTTAITGRNSTTITAGTTTAIAAGNTTTIAAGITTTIATGNTTAISARNTSTITAESTTTIAAGNFTAITAGNTTAIAAGNTMAITAGNTTEITAGNITVITAGNSTIIAARNTTTITADNITDIAAGNSTTTAARNTLTVITTGNSTAITAGKTTTTTAANTMTIAAGSTTAIAASNTSTITAGNITDITARNTTTITAGNTTTITAGNTTTITAGNTTTIAAGNTMTIASGSTTAITTVNTTAFAVGNTVAVAPTAPVSPAKEVGHLPAAGITTQGIPLATANPVTTPAPAFGTQKGLATAASTFIHITTAYKNPAPEPRPTHGIIMPAASLYPFGIEQGDQEYVQRTVDFNSPLFKPEIGFPFGKSLRDTLYFTDNGQIIFPPTDNYIPSNPNPPPQGFSGQESLPMVAAFWDDADFSQGVGITWYQEYSTLNPTQDPLVHDVEAKIEKYLKTSYVAKWTLKVTWEKAPAYPSRHDDTQTSTYQAVLTTDGNHSFALLLYQDGGMRWDYTKLAADNVLIGFSSGDGYAQNNELSQEPPDVKYRPDQHSSTGTDVRGLWLYRLDSRSQVNFRLRCLMWLDAEPAPAAWNLQLLPCPCSRPQAELAPRYRWSRGSVDSSVRMLRTASPSPAGAGVRCLYRGGSLLEGWQERVWTLPIHPTSDGELEAFDWCCRRVGKPLFCTRFAEKRPRVGCEGYVPPTPAGAFGDPHITTLDGLTYTFNGLGDFVLLLARDMQASFVLHGRTAQTGTAQATNFVAFAAQYVSTTTTTVEWTLGSQGDIQVLLNDKNIPFSYSQDMGAEVYYSPGVLLVNDSSVTAIFDGAIAISISATSGILSVVCSLPDQYRNSTNGLLGVWDHDPTDDFQMPNGTSIPVNSSEEEIYSYGMTWAVGEHSLFAQPLDSPVTNFRPVFLSRLRQENESRYQLAASQCYGSKECIYDSLSTGDMALGLATQTLAASFQQKKTVLNAFPPTIIGDAFLTAFRTERVSKHCSRSQECDYNDTVTVEESFLQLAACKCEGGYSGPFCEDPPDRCTQGCVPGVGFDLHTGCGPCPAGLTGDGRPCSDIDECAQGTVCPRNATCTNTVGSYVCSCPTGEEGQGCSSACGSRSCPEGYCSNGGLCHLHSITCTPACTCPSAFTDQRCLVAGGDFRPLPNSDLPRRSVRLQVRTLQNTTVGEVNDTVSGILGSLKIKAFQSNINITQMTDDDGFTFAMVSTFAYDSHSTVIRFLNEELQGAIISAFKGTRGRREAGMRLLFQPLHQDSITDLVKLTVAELRLYFSCGLYGYKGYQLDYVGTVGFVCISPCKTGYCHHGGWCQHLPEGPTCSCLPFSIFSPGGARCERLAISLAAFLGILLGALALLCLLLAVTCLALSLCRRHRHQHRGATKLAEGPPLLLALPHVPEVSGISTHREAGDE